MIQKIIKALLFNFNFKEKVLTFQKTTTNSLHAKRVLRHNDRVFTILKEKKNEPLSVKSKYNHQYIYYK